MPIDAAQPYDDSNIFARILRGELPSKTVYEDEFALAFHDINPQAPLHILAHERVLQIGRPFGRDWPAEVSNAELVEHDPQRVNIGARRRGLACSRCRQ